MYNGTAIALLIAAYASSHIGYFVFERLYADQCASSIWFSFLAQGSVFCILLRRMSMLCQANVQNGLWWLMCAAGLALQGMMNNVTNSAKSAQIADGHLLLESVLRRAITNALPTTTISPPTPPSPSADGMSTYATDARHASFVPHVNVIAAA
jgi:hypothetical protein